MITEQFVGKSNSKAIIWPPATEPFDKSNKETRGVQFCAGNLFRVLFIKTVWLFVALNFGTFN